MKKAIVVGASSGIGHEVARLLIAEGWAVGVAARRIDKLTDLQAMEPERVYTAQIDVNNEDAETSLLQLIEHMNGIDLYFHAAGIGWQNPSLNADIELKTMETNAVGFTRMIGCAYRYFANKGGGHIACITSIAGTKGLGPAPAYSATKAMQNTYLQALEQLAASSHLPMLMTTEKVSRSILKAINSRRHICVIDSRWCVLTYLWRHIPNWIWRRMKLC